MRNATAPNPTSAQAHELFIRTTTPTRPSGPLRLNANVVARFAVDPSGDLSRVQKQLHASSVAEKKKKIERQIVVLDTPPPEAKAGLVGRATKTKKKAPGKPTIVRGGLTASAGPSSRGVSPFASPALSQPIIQSVTAPAPPAAAPSAASIAANVVANAPIIDDITSLRGRLVHFLALGPQATKDITRGVLVDLGGETTNQDNLREETIAALREV